MNNVFCTVVRVFEFGINERKTGNCFNPFSLTSKMDIVNVFSLMLILYPLCIDL